MDWTVDIDDVALNISSERPSEIVKGQSGELRIRGWGYSGMFSGRFLTFFSTEFLKVTWL